MTATTPKPDPRPPVPGPTIPRPTRPDPTRAPAQRGKSSDVERPAPKADRTAAPRGSEEADVEATHGRRNEESSCPHEP